MKNVVIIKNENRNYARIGNKIIPFAKLVFKTNNPEIRITKNHEIHHLDNNPKNDNPENLNKFTKKQHKKITLKIEKSHREWLKFSKTKRGEIIS